MQVMGAAFPIRLTGDDGVKEILALGSNRNRPEACIRRRVL